MYFVFFYESLFVDRFTHATENCFTIYTEEVVQVLYTITTIHMRQLKIYIME